MSSGPNVPRANRKRKKIELTLSDAAHKTLSDYVARHNYTSRSAVVESLIQEHCGGLPSLDW